MAGYVIFDIDVRDAAGYEEYRALGAPTVPEHGGRFIVRGGQAATLEGDWVPRRVVVIAFHDVDAARRWYGSPRYQAAKAIRERTARSRAVLAAGVGGAEPERDQAGYAVIDVAVQDAERFAQYRSVGVPTLERHGARVLVRTDASEPLEGDWCPQRLVVLEFDSVARARTWHGSSEYQAAIEIRRTAARIESIVVQGL